MNVDHELPIVFDCEGQELIGVIHNADANTHIGVLIVVGGPQYRVGSHRQFVLLARYLAKEGIPVMRFDYRGMGDSPGNTRDFNHIGKDIASAINTFQMYNKAVQKIVIWGLCDAASAALFYAYEDERVTGLVLLNPWVRTEYGEANAYLKKYYKNRLVSREFWQKILSGRFNVKQSLMSFVDILTKVISKKHNKQKQQSLPDRMLQEEPNEISLSLHEIANGRTI